MARPFFFGGPQTSQSQSQYLVQFKAGKMTKDGNLVSPVKEKKGLVYLHQSSDDTLMHFCWKDRTSGQVEDDLIIFPDEAEFLKVPQCTTGRVFVLKFKTSPRRLFFWSQEAKDDKDEEYVSKINEYINNPPAARSGGSGGGGHSLLSGSDMNPEDELRNLFSNPDMSTQQLMSMLGSVRGLGGPAGLASLLGSVGASQNSSNRSSSSSSSSSVATPAAPQTPSTTPAIVSSGTTSESSTTTTTGGTNSPAGLRLADLQTIISGLSSTGQTGTTGAPAADDVNVDLSSSVNLELLRPLLTNDSFMQRIREMLPAATAAAAASTTNAPSSTPQIAQQFSSTIQSPQFQQALSSFCSALQSGQLGPLIQQFGLPDECVAAANSANLEAFVKALEKKPKTDEAKKSSEAETKKDDDMALD